MRPEAMALTLLLALAGTAGAAAPPAPPVLQATALRSADGSVVDLAVTVDRPALGRFHLVAGGRRLASMAHLRAGQQTERLGLAGLPPDATEIMWEVEARFRRYVFERYVGGPGKTEGRFMNPRAILAGSSGGIYVVDGGNDRVQCFDADYRYRFEFGGFSWDPARTRNEAQEGRFDEPTAIAEGSNREIFVTDRNNGRVVRMDRDGRFLGEFGSGDLRLPEGIAADRSGHLAVCDTDGDRVLRYDTAGRRDAEVGGYGWGSRQFNGPSAAAYDRAGNLYVVDRENARVQVFDPALRPAFDIRLDGVRPVAVHVDDEHFVYVCDGAAPRVLILDNGFQAIHQIPAPGDVVRLGRPMGIATSPDGRLHIVDQARNVVTLLRVEQDALLVRGKIEIASPR